jgi:CHAT domain-containing protein
MDSNEVVYEPSAAVFAAILDRSRQRRPAEKKLAAFGDAVFQSESRQNDGREDETRQSGDLSQFERLPASGEEVKRITRLLPEGEALSLLRFDARRDLFLERETELARYGIIHIATHSRLDEVFPELSSLVFSMVDEKGKPQNGLLTFYEISDLELPVDMVVLSACRTALGKEIKGEGVIGLGRAFLHAGASSVVVSLWDVNDKVTAVLMERFYQGMFHEKLSPSEALRQARIYVRSQPQWQAPYYWAPFVLEGDWHGAGANISRKPVSIDAGGRPIGTRNRGQTIKRRVRMPDKPPIKGDYETTPPDEAKKPPKGDYQTLPPVKGDYETIPPVKGDYETTPPAKDE